MPATSSTCCPSCFARPRPPPDDAARRRRLTPPPDAAAAPHSRCRWRSLRWCDSFDTLWSLRAPRGPATIGRKANVDQQIHTLTAVWTRRSPGSGNASPENCPPPLDNQSLARGVHRPRQAGLPQGPGAPRGALSVASGAEPAPSGVRNVVFLPLSAPPRPSARGQAGGGSGRERCLLARRRAPALERASQHRHRLGLEPAAVSNPTAHPNPLRPGGGACATERHSNRGTMPRSSARPPRSGCPACSPRLG